MANSAASVPIIAFVSDMIESLPSLVPRAQPFCADVRRRAAWARTERGRAKDAG